MTSNDLKWPLLTYFCRPFKPRTLAHRGDYSSSDSEETESSFSDSSSVILNFEPTRTSTALPTEPEMKPEVKPEVKPKVEPKVEPPAGVKTAVIPVLIAGRGKMINPGKGKFSKDTPNLYL